MPRKPRKQVRNSATTTTTSASASTSLPFAYRLTLLVLEPLFALNGALMVFRDPTGYAAGMTRDLELASRAYDPRANGFLYTQLGAAWLLFAFNEAVVLRLVDDLRIWRLLCWGKLISDVAFVISSAQAVGGWESFVQFGVWSAFDWAVFVSTFGPMLVRVLVVLGIGVRKG
ncbi:hypothetical protein P885DRAFT_74604 [Corynascus similis CBS 632.67]